MRVSDMNACVCASDRPELHTTSAWWQLPQALLLHAFASKQDALNGFLGAAHALHVVAKVAVMADARDLQKSVGNGDGAWFATQDGDGRGRARDVDGQVVAVGAAEPTDRVLDEPAQFVTNVYPYDHFPGRVGLREPPGTRTGEQAPSAPEARD